MSPEPIILVDSREQDPLVFNRFPSRVEGLPVGDYGIEGFSDWANPAFVVERKSIDDLIGSLTQGRKRFMREVEKLRQFRFAALVVDGDRSTVELAQYRSTASPLSILSSLDAIAVRCGVHVIWAGDHTGSARIVENLVHIFCRGVEKDWNRLRGPKTVS